MTTDLPAALPRKGILFIGGHKNMVKKLMQLYPGWIYANDDHLPRQSTISENLVFYWTAHSSHKLMRFVYKRLPKDSTVLYVTATNIPRLLNEMKLLCSKGDDS